MENLPRPHPPPSHSSQVHQQRHAPFDAFTLSFSTISTGGFTVTNAGLLSYGGIATPLIIAVFMIAGSINFTFYFHGLKGKFYRIYEPEFFLFLVILFFGCLMMSLPLWSGGTSLMDALAQGSFMAISAQTSDRFFSYFLRPLAVCLPASDYDFNVHRRYVGIDHRRYQSHPVFHCFEID